MKKLLFISLVFFILTGCPQPGDESGENEDSVSPTVLSIDPSSGTENIDPSTAITITFSEPIDESTITSNSAILSNRGMRIDTSLNYTDSVLIMEPDVRLDYGASYNVFLSSSIKDLAGNSLDDSSLSFSFSTTLYASIRIFAPSGLYYTSVPDLNYSIENGYNQSVTLNGLILDGRNNTPLSESVTGLNTLVVSAETAAGEEVSTSITFFLNDLTLTENDDFNRADETTITGWDRFTPTGAATLGVSGNKLIGTDSDTDDAVDIIWSSYDPDLEDECLMAVDVDIMEENNQLFLVYWSTGDYPDDWDNMQLILEPVYINGSFSNYKLSMSEYDYTSTILMDEIEFLRSNTFVSMIFYRNGNDYQGVLIGSTEKRLFGYVRAVDYTRSKNIALTMKGLQFMPNNNANNGDVLMKADNFVYYK